MNDLCKGLLLWGLAGVLAWFFYSIFINAKSKIGFIDSDKVAYRKGIATIVEKQVAQTKYEVKFTYSEDDNTFRGTLPVSQKEFNQKQIGHKMSIFYGIHFPHLWMPVKNGKVFYISIVLITVAAVLFLMGHFRFIVQYTPNSPIFKAVQKKRYKALYRALKKSPTAPESAVAAGSERSHIEQSVGTP